MKVKILSAVLILLCSSVFAKNQETGQKGFFIQPYVNVSKALKIEHSYFIPNVGNRTDELDASSSGILGANVIVGYFVVPRLSLGLGLGLQNYISPDFKIVPIHFDLKWYNKDALSSMFFSCQYSSFVHIEDVYEKGQSLGLGFGYKYTVFKAVSVFSEATINIPRIDSGYNGDKDLYDYTTFYSTRLFLNYCIFS